MKIDIKIRLLGLLIGLLCFPIIIYSLFELCSSKIFLAENEASNALEVCSIDDQNIKYSFWTLKKEYQPEYCKFPKLEYFIRIEKLDDFANVGNILIKDSFIQSYSFEKFYFFGYNVKNRKLERIDVSDDFYCSPLQKGNNCLVSDDVFHLFYFIKGREGEQYLSFLPRSDFLESGVFLFEKASNNNTNENDIVFYHNIHDYKLDEIKVLSLANCNLKSIPTIIVKCKNLKKLFMPYNNISFSASDMSILESLSNLEVLDIRYNNISNALNSDLEKFKRLKKIKRLYIGGKQCLRQSKIPNVFMQIQSLESLSISDVKCNFIFNEINPNLSITIYSSFFSTEQMQSDKIKVYNPYVSNENFKEFEKLRN